MKKLLLVFALFIAACSSGYSQTEKGSWIISLHGNAESDVHSTAVLKPSLKIKPAAQWMVIDNLGLGVSFLSSLPGADYYSLQSGPFIRQYIAKFDVQPYLEVSPGIIYKKYSSYTATDFFLRPGVGVIYWFHKNVGIDTNINLDLFAKYREWHWNFGVNVSF